MLMHGFNQPGVKPVEQDAWYYSALLLWKGTFFTTLILISKGWCVIRSELAVMEKRAIAVTIVAYLLAMLLNEISQYILFIVRGSMSIAHRADHRRRRCSKTSYTSSCT